MAKLTANRVLVFDVYGTLINWEAGILDGLFPLFASSNSSTAFDSHHLLTIFHRLEAKEQTANPSLPYSALLALIYPKVAAELGLAAAAPPSQEDSEAFGNGIGEWPAFPDTVDALKRLKKHFKLVVLSNVDRASFARTLEGPLKGVEFDAVLTAEDVGSYKPDPRNFNYMLEYVKKEFGVEKDQVLQTAQSQFHDHVPARKVGIKSVWIERKGAVMGYTDTGEETWDWKFPTLGAMADEVEKE